MRAHFVSGAYLCNVKVVNRCAEVASGLRVQRHLRSPAYSVCTVRLILQGPVSDSLELTQTPCLLIGDVGSAALLKADAIDRYSATCLLTQRKSCHRNIPLPQPQGTKDRDQITSARAHLLTWHWYPD
jgi:hypothetical protein